MMNLDNGRVVAPRVIAIGDKSITIPYGYIAVACHRRAYTIQPGDMLAVLRGDGYVWEHPVSGVGSVAFPDSVIITPLQFEFDDQSIVTLHGYFRWCANNLGFGELYFHHDNGRIKIDVETLHRDTVRKMLHDFVDHVMDNAELDD